MSDSPASSHLGAVFLSYAREDSAAVHRIAEALRASGVEVWFDQNELVGGDAWDAKIRGQIATCALFVPVISAATQARLEGYFRLEWKLAANRSHTMAEERTFLLPVVIDATRDAEAKVPAEFKAVQWTRLADGEATPQFAERIIRLLAPASAAARPSRPGSTEPTGQEPRTTPSRRVPGWIYAAAAVAVVAVAALFALRKPAVTDKSIAVLPFANLGADKNDEYLGDGMTEELLNVFAKLPKLKVAARTSSFFFKGKNLPIAEVGKQLGVAYVLEGSVRKTGNKLRITAQLINATDGYHLWSETYDRDLTDLLAIQAEVSQKVVAALLGTLGVEESRTLTRRATVNPEAHRLYLLGRFHFGKATEAGWTSAEQYFKQAIQVDPNYALAYCGLADNYGFFGSLTLPGREAWARQKAAAEKALALDPNLAEAHFSYGLALAQMFEWQPGERAIRRAIELNPNLPLVRDQLAWLLTCAGRFDEAIAESTKAVEMDPLSSLINGGRSGWLYFARRYDEAMAQARKTLELDPNQPFVLGNVGWCHIWRGQLPEALAAFLKQLAADPNPWWTGNVGYAYAVNGDRAKATQILGELDELAKRRYVNPGARVSIYLGLGEKEKALDWLEKCFEDQDGMCWWLKVDPLFDGIRAEPRFQALLKKVGLDK